MKTYKYHIGIFLLIVLFVLTIPYAWKLVQIVFFPKHVKVLQQLSLFQWAAVGFVSYSIIRRFLNKNILWFETFTHELTHIVVAMLFLRKVHSFHAEEGSGVVSFHVNCFIHQTGKYQTDINQYPLLFSYLFINVARLINVCIIVVAFFPSYNVFTSFWRCAVTIFDNAVGALGFVI